MGNTGICCHNNVEMKPHSGELTTERYSNAKAQKPPISNLNMIYSTSNNNTTNNTQSTSRMLFTNKIITEADEMNHHNLQNFQGLPGGNYNKFIHTVYENEREMNERIAYLRSIVEKAPKLNLEIINSNVLPQGIVLKINAMGLENSLRDKGDGYTFFGYQENLNNPIVDFLIRPKDQEYDNRYLGRHFQIYFNADLMKYYMKDLGNGFGTFIKIQSETLIKDNSLINLGDSYLVCTMGVEDDQVVSDFVGSDQNIKMQGGNKEYENLLNIKIFSGNNKYDPMNFLPTKSSIKVGRSPDCEISIEDNMLSRLHCTIEYRENAGWIIRDGYLTKLRDGSYESKHSTNGTWIYAMEDTMIYEGMIFKANHNLFEVKIN